MSDDDIYWGISQQEANLIDCNKMIEEMEDEIH